MPLETQAKLLRVLQERESSASAATQPIEVDVRVIAATNHDLERGARGPVPRGSLLSAARRRVVIPPLRERREDIPLLIDRFLKERPSASTGRPKPLTGAALRACVATLARQRARAPPAIEQALLLAPGDESTPARPFGDVRGAPARPRRPIAAPATRRAGVVPRRQGAGGRRRSSAISSLGALRRHGGNITKAAEEVGMYRQNFQQKMRELGITAEDAAK